MQQLKKPKNIRYSPSTHNTLQSGFTLVELIVVITILAILGTIGFMNMGSFQGSARDSARVSDINSVNKSLEIFNVGVGGYPDPSNISGTVVYNGGVVWTQGTLGDSVIGAIKRISKKPVDPKTGGEYTYSLSSTRKEYQIKADFEGPISYDESEMNELLGVEKVFADSTNGVSCYIKGNYNGVLTKTSTGGITYVIANPGLITSDTGATVNYMNLSGKILCDGRSSPCAITFTPTVVYSGTSLPSTSAEILAMMLKLQQAYSGSNITTIPAIQNILSASGSALEELGGVLVEGSLGGSVNLGEPVNGACTGIPTNAQYYNLSSTGYTLVSAAAGTSLIASYNVTPTQNTCQFKCATGYSYIGGACILTNVWTTKASMPTARYYTVAGIVNNKIYVIGGNDGTYTNINQEYDPVANTWATKTAMTTTRAGATVGVVNGKIYVIGGYNGSTLNTVEEYNPSTNTWATKANMTTARYYMSAGVVNNKIYVIGGGAPGSTLNTVEEYDPATNTWATKANMTTARRDFAIGVVNNKIYVIGGVDNSGNVLNNVEEYDPVANTWATKANMTTARGYLTAGTINNKIYAIGGVDTTYSNKVEVYDPLTNTWATKANMLSAKRYMSSEIYDGRIYIFGGNDGTTLSTTDAYTAP